MTVYVYNTPTGTEHMKKDISSQIGEYSGSVRGSVVVESPVILLNATLLSGNYAYIPDFGRYYYIRSKNIVRKDLTEVQLEVDVLMSYQQQILNARCICARRVSKESADRYIPNSGYKTRVYKILGSIDAPSEGGALEFDSSYVLVGMYG